MASIQGRRPLASVTSLPPEQDLDATRRRIDDLSGAQRAYFRSGATLPRSFREEQLHSSSPP